MIIRFLLAFLIATCFGPGALASDYILQQPGDSNVTGLWKGKRPTPGEDCPAGSKVCEWSIQAGDNCLAHYSIDDNGTQVYTAAGPEQIFDRPIPNPIGLKRALNSNSNIPDLVKVQLTPYLVLLDSYALDPDGTKTAWQRTINVLGIPSDISGIIESAAAEFGMPLR